MSEFSDMVIKLLNGGANPNGLVSEFNKAVDESDCGWDLWGDGRWRSDTVCSICGSGIPGICGDEDNPTQEVISRSEYERRQAGGNGV